MDSQLSKPPMNTQPSWRRKFKKKKEKQSKQKYTAQVPLNTYVYGTLYIIAGRRKS